MKTATLDLLSSRLRVSFPELGRIIPAVVGRAKLSYEKLYDLLAQHLIKGP